MSNPPVGNGAPPSTSGTRLRLLACAVALSAGAAALIVAILLLRSVLT